jgi:hypothetical protein
MPEPLTLGSDAPTLASKAGPFRDPSREGKVLTVRRRIATLVHGTLRLAVVMSLLTVMIPSPAWPTAAAFKGQSTAAEGSEGRDYSGVGSIRGEGGVSDQPFDGCAQLFTGSPIYDTEWVVLNSDSTNWVELGTLHQCGDAIRNWFWGRGANNV